MQWGPAADAKVSTRRRVTTQTSHSPRGTSLLIFCQLFMHTLRIHAVKLDYQALAQALGDGTLSDAVETVQSVAACYFEAHLAHISYTLNVPNVPSGNTLPTSLHMSAISSPTVPLCIISNYLFTFISFPCHSVNSSNTMQFTQTSLPKQSSTALPN